MKTFGAKAIGMMLQDNKGIKRLNIAGECLMVLLSLWFPIEICIIVDIKKIIERSCKSLVVLFLWVKIEL